MAPCKTRAFVLQVLPYQESSAILYLYTEAMGIVHGVAKGIRRRGKRSNVVERGALIELLVYARPTRSLHTLGSVSVLEYFARTRSDLPRVATRDAALEIAVRSIHGEESNPELFLCFEAFLRALDRPDAAVPQLLWRFYMNFAQHLGFGLDLQSCGQCGRPVGAGGGAV